MGAQPIPWPNSASCMWKGTRNLAKPARKARMQRVVFVCRIKMNEYQPPATSAFAGQDLPGPRKWLGREPPLPVQRGGLAPAKACIGGLQ